MGALRCRQAPQDELVELGRVSSGLPALPAPALGLPSPCSVAQGTFSHVTPALFFPAEKKMMSSASAAGTQQIYSQGSPFPAGHAGKTFRYVPAGGGQEDAPRPGSPGSQSSALCAANVSEWLLSTGPGLG